MPSLDNIGEGSGSRKTRKGMTAEAEADCSYAT